MRESMSDRITCPKCGRMPRYCAVSEDYPVFDDDGTATVRYECECDECGIDFEAYVSFEYKNLEVEYDWDSDEDDEDNEDDDEDDEDSDEDY